MEYFMEYFYVLGRGQKIFVRYNKFNVFIIDIIIIMENLNGEKSFLC